MCRSETFLQNDQKCSIQKHTEKEIKLKETCNDDKLIMVMVVNLCEACQMTEPEKEKKENSRMKERSRKKERNEETTKCVSWEETRVVQQIVLEN